MNDFVSARQKRLEPQLSPDHVLLIGAGRPIPVPGGMDRVYPFRSHPDHSWLSGHRTPGAVLAYDPDSGWRDFTPDVTEDDRVWEGLTQRPGEAISGLSAWLDKRKGRMKVVLGAPEPLLADVLSDRSAAAKYQETILHTRRPKDQVEVELMRKACAATIAGHERARAFAQPGVTEREIQIELEAACFRAGGEAMGYDAIVGAGTNSAVLHFAPGGREVREGDYVLIDAGCEVGGYTADVTRTFVVGEPSAQQTELHAIVREALEYGISRCVPGTEWRELHLACAELMTKGLISLGILKGEAPGLVERDAHALFFPHGLGHLVGLGVRDASGYLPGRERSDRFGLAFLRMDLPLETGYLTTVEPGLYFIEPMLNDPARRERFADCVNWNEVDRWLGVGGVRLEDNVLVTASEPVNLTRDCPLGLS